MPEHSLQALTPMGKHEPCVDQIGGMTISEVCDVAFASVATRSGKAKPFVTAFKKALKCAPPTPGQANTAGNLTVFWSGPEQWFIEAPEETHEDIAAVLLRDFKSTASVTEQSGGWCRFDLEGAASVDALQRLCAVDSQTMQADAATRSVIEHIGVFILCRQAGQHFSIYAPRSFAGSLHHALTTAAHSIA